VEFLTIGAHAVARSSWWPARCPDRGAGPIGLSVLQFALTRAPRRGLSRRWIPPPVRGRFDADVLSEYDDRPASVVFDCTGDEEAIRASFDRVGPAGRLMLVGQFLGFIPSTHTPFIRKDSTSMASRNSHHQFPRVTG